jgi:hypothetical protein
MGGIVDMAHQLFRDDGHIAFRLVGCLGLFPFDAGRHFGNPALDFTVEILDNFRAASIPPRRAFFYFLPFFNTSSRAASDAD